MRPPGEALRAGIVVVLTGLATTPSSVSVGASDGPMRLPPRDYVLVDNAAAAKPARLLATVREALQKAVIEAGLAGPGYPRACHVARAPAPGRSGGYEVTCGTGGDDPAEADGILFDADGRFLQLSVVEFPDSRLYLMEVFVVPRLPYPKLQTEERWTIPRVVVHFPQIPTSWHPRIWRALERGIRSLGVTVLER